MKRLFGNSSKTEFKKAFSKRTNFDVYLNGKEYEGFTSDDAAYLYNKVDNTYSFQHFGNKEGAINALLNAVKDSN